MTSDRLTNKFKQIQVSNKVGIILYVTAGFPDMDTTLSIIPRLVSAGADCIEIGVPFTDPLADGPTIQKSSSIALRNKVSLTDCLSLVTQIRNEVPDTPLLLMGYYNPIYQYGLGRFAKDCSMSGIDGLIIPDLPPEELDPLLSECRPLGLHIIPLVAPTSTDERIRKACKVASGFVYCVSVTGVTGERKSISSDVFDVTNRVRSYTALPLAIGFGISSPDHIKSISGHAEAAVIGSGLIRSMMEVPLAQVIINAEEYVRGLVGSAGFKKGDNGF